MEIKIKVPGWVNTEDEGICMLFSFLRRIALEYDEEALDVYGYDIRKITDIEADNVHLVINEHIDTTHCKIAKLNREHFVFKMSHYRRGINEVTIRKPESHIIWAYLMGCSNYNLVEPDNDLIDKNHRPHYTPMYRLDREFFNHSRSDRGQWER